MSLNYLVIIEFMFCVHSFIKATTHIDTWADGSDVYFIDLQIFLACSYLLNLSHNYPNASVLIIRISVWLDFCMACNLCSQRDGK